MPNEISNQTPTMSSREIAELVNSRHDDVKRSIVRLADRGVIGLPPLAEYPDSLGRRATEYRIAKRDSYVIVAQLSPEFTARLVDRWQELEAAATQPVHVLPKSFSEALRELASTVERVEQQQVVIDGMKPKADFHDAVAEAENCQEMQVVAKVLGTGRTRLFYQLRQRGLLMSGNLPYQQYIDAGYFRVVERVWRDPAQKPHTTFKTLVTGKGLAYIQKLLTPPASPAATAH